MAQGHGDGQASLRSDAKRRPWRPGSRGRRYGDESSKEKRGLGKGAHNGADGVPGEAMEDGTTQIDGEDAAAVVEEEGADDVAATSQLRSGVVFDEGSSGEAFGHEEGG